MTAASGATRSEVTGWPLTRATAFANDSSSTRPERRIAFERVCRPVRKRSRSWIWREVRSFSEMRSSASLAGGIDERAEALAYREMVVRDEDSLWHEERVGFWLLQGIRQEGEERRMPDVAEPNNGVSSGHQPTEGPPGRLTSERRSGDRDDPAARTALRGSPRRQAH